MYAYYASESIFDSAQRMYYAALQFAIQDL